MQVRFYAYRKRINSTKIPTQKDVEGQLSFFADCILKDSTSVIAPQITLIFPQGLLSPSSYNYAYIPDFHRYYFVTDITFAQNRVLYTLACDVLASYWETLKNTTQYVLRSASAGDLSVVDSLYPVTAEITYGGADVTGWKLPTLSSGYYVLGIVNNATNAVGGISYYVMSNSQFAGLRNALLTDFSYMGIKNTEISAELQRAIINPFQYIVSCRWFPEAPPTSGTVSTITICGWEFTGGTASLLSAGGVITKAITVSNLARHPQIGRGRWLSLAPYSNYYLYYPPFGVIQLDPTKIVNSSIGIGIRIDCVSGIGNITVSSGENLLYYAECQIGVDIQLSQVSYIGGIISDVENVIGAASSGAQLGLGGNAAVSALGAAGNALGSIVTSNTFKGAVTGIASGETTFAGIGTAANAANGQLSVQGNNGNLSSYIIQPHIFWRFSHVVSNDNEDLGTPCCKKFKLSSLAGFTTIMHPDIDTVLATQPEIAALASYMTNGFFIEGNENNEQSTV
jgi:hypothetical protein